MNETCFERFAEPKDAIPVIASFTGDYWFLSNFAESPFVDDNGPWKTVEHYFQAMKTEDILSSEFARIRDAPTPGEAKKLGRRVWLRADWEDVKIQIMKRALRMKFAQNPDLRRRLLATGSAELIEGNDWGDRIWGQVNGEGGNWLGKLLMHLRTELRGDMTLEELFEDAMAIGVLVAVFSFDGDDRYQVVLHKNGGGLLASRTGDYLQSVISEALDEAVTSITFGTQP